MACRRAMAVAVLAGLLGLLGGRPGRAAPPAVPVEDTKLYLERDTKAQEQLAKARQAAAAGQWREASEAYQRVADFVGRDGTQPVVPSRDEPSVLIPIQEAASVDLARALAGRPLELYREAHDGPAHKLLERALPARDVALLRAVVRRYLATSSGDEALSALGSIAFERGDYVGALTAWRRLLALCREPSVSPPDVKVRQWACLRALGRTHEAAALAGDLAAHHADATVRFGGREVGVAGVLARPFAPARPGPVNEWPELGGCPSRAREPLGLEEVGEPVWRFRVPNAAVGSSARRAFEERGLRVPLALHAQAADGRVVVSNEAAVYALDAATGGLVWMYPDAPGPPQAAAREDATHAVACAAGRATVRFADSVAAFDLKSGRRLWHHAFVKPEAEPEKPKADEPEK